MKIKTISEFFGKGKHSNNGKVLSIKDMDNIIAEAVIENDNPQKPKPPSKKL